MRACPSRRWEGECVKESQAGQGNLGGLMGIGHRCRLYERKACAWAACVGVQCIGGGGSAVNGGRATICTQHVHPGSARRCAMNF